MDTQPKIEDIRPAEVSVEKEEEKIDLGDIEKKAKEAFKKGGASALDDLHTGLVEQAKQQQNKE